MVEFPQYDNVMGECVTTLIGIGLLFGVYLFRKTIFQVPSRAILFSLVGVVFTLAGGAFLLTSVRQIHSFRSIDPKDVKSFSITRSPDADDHSGAGPVLTIDDPAVIRGAFESLRNCRLFTPRRQHFKDGYDISLVFEGGHGSENYRISVYRQSEIGAIFPGTVRARVGSGADINLGDYDCPDFFSWVGRTVDPFFAGLPAQKSGRR